MELVRCFVPNNRNAFARERETVAFLASCFWAFSMDNECTLQFRAVTLTLPEIDILHSEQSDLMQKDISS